MGLTLEHADALRLFGQLGLLLLLARVVSLALRRIGQPPVVGALLAGVLLGPSVFGEVWPHGYASVFGDRNGTSTLAAVVQLCLVLLLIVLGAEVDLGLIRRLGRAAATVSLGSIVVPLVAGVGLAAVLPSVLQGKAESALPFDLLVGAVVSVSSLPLVATIVRELGLMRRNFGQLALAAGAVNDVYGFLLLVVGLAFVGSPSPADVLLPLGGLVLVAAVLFGIGQRLTDALLRRVLALDGDVATALAVSLLTAIIATIAMQAVGVEGALGAFLAGMVLGRSRFQRSEALGVLETMTAAVFSPLYFASAGLQVDLTSLGSVGAVASVVGLVVVGLASKYVGTWAGARAGGMERREGLALGLLLNGRGALQVIVANAALSAGVFSAAGFSAVIVAALVSSALVPPTLRRATRGWSGTDTEKRRLADEAEQRSNVVVRGQRLLLPTRGSANAVAAARVLHRAWPEDAEVTVVSIADSGEHPDTSAVERVFDGRPLRRQRLTDEDPVGAILDEAKLGYGVIALAAAETRQDQHLLPPVVAGVLGRTRLPLLIVRRGRDDRELAASAPGPQRPGRVLVPISGSDVSRAAHEVAGRIARADGSELVLLHVLDRPETDGSDRSAATSRDEAVGALRSLERPTAETAALTLMSEAQTDALSRDLSVRTVLRRGLSTAAEIEGCAEEEDADIVVVGTALRRVGEQVFLGHSVEHILEHAADPTVVVVVLPERGEPEE